MQRSEHRQMRALVGGFLVGESVAGLGTHDDAETQPITAGKSDRRGRLTPHALIGNVERTPEVALHGQSFSPSAFDMNSQSVADRPGAQKEILPKPGVR